MQPVTISEIVSGLQKLTSDQLAAVYEFVLSLAEKRSVTNEDIPIDGLQTMIASEGVLRRDWDRPEEDAAWQDL
jgi:hypothetical protein